MISTAIMTSSNVKARSIRLRPWVDIELQHPRLRLAVAFPREIERDGVEPGDVLVLLIFALQRHPALLERHPGEHVLQLLGLPLVIEHDRLRLDLRHAVDEAAPRAGVLVLQDLGAQTILDALRERDHRQREDEY